jgi:hypothetical protein
MEPMLDDPERTQQLLTTLKASLPFEVDLTPSLAQHLRAQHVALDVRNRQVVSEVSYAGDEGGIVCHMATPDGREVVVISLTHVRVPPSLPFAAKVLQYQRSRVKKLSRQGRG